MKRRRPHRLCRWMLLMIAAGFLPPHPSTAQEISTTEATRGISAGVEEGRISVEKDGRSPSTRVSVKLPTSSRYSQYIAKVIDLSEDSIRDAVRTFLASVINSTVINIHNLHAGHKYKIQLLGRRGNETDMIREQLVLMDPQAPDFSRQGATVVATLNNITIKTAKPERALQDSFVITYRQLSPEINFPQLEISDIPDQKDLEVYLGNLNPGRDYSISVIAVKDGIKSRPWEAVFTTKPDKLSSLSAVDSPPSCANITWTLPSTSGADHFEVVYGPTGGPMQKEIAPSSTRSLTACSSLSPGVPSTFSVTVVKSSVASTPRTIEHTIRPRPPNSLNVRPDTWSSKYRIWSDISNEGRVDGCQLSVVSDTVERIDVTARLDSNSSTCEFLLPLRPGSRYEFSISSTSGKVRSSKVQRSVALPPAFDMSSFGLNIQEARGGLELSWPKEDQFIGRLKEIWNKIVGSESLLHARITQWKTNETRQFESSPFTLRPIFISNLTMGSCYKVQLYTVTKTGIVSESRFDETIRISPPPVEVTLHSVARSVASLRLTLMGTTGKISNSDCQVSLVVSDQNGLAVFDRRLPLPTEMADVELDGLRPFHKYTANAQVLCGSAGSACAASSRSMRAVSFITRQDRPGPVLAPKVTALNSYSARLVWQPPALPNGLLTHYVVTIQPEEGEPWSVNVAAAGGTSGRSMEAIVDGLRGGSAYRFLLRAVTEAGAGDPPAVSDAPRVVMPIQAPPRPLVSPSVIGSSVGANSLTLQMLPGLFDGKNGPIVRTAILVSEIPSDGLTTFEEPASTNVSYTWSEVQSLEIWPTYTAIVIESMAIEQNPPLSQDIGTDASCSNLPLHFVCNGPLKPVTSYRFKIRIYTSPSLYSDSPYSAVIVTGSDGGQASARILAASISVLLLALLAVFLLLYCTRNRSSKRSYTESSRTTSTNNSAHSLKEGQWTALRMIMAERAAECLARLGFDSPSTASSGNENDGTSSPVKGSSRPNNHLQPPVIVNGHRRTGSLRERTGVAHRLDGLPGLPNKPPATIIAGVNTDRNRPVSPALFSEHLRIMSADTDFRFSEEYELLRNVGVGASSTAAELPQNRPKNRFSNILPYDHSRVKLLCEDDVDGEDYINANFIPGAASRREFIAAQGPLPSTRDAFWRMVMEQQCPCIVALTRCIEKGRDKCHQYWPDRERLSLLYDDIEVTMLSETQTDEIVIRDLRLTPMSNPSAARTITHMHYMAWPDFGVPESPKGILRFLRLYRQKLPRSPNNKPTVVHCSAGVGRSGTFMAIDRLLHGLALSRPLDVFGTVYEMRLERCSMVQNEQQYIFIHHALLLSIQNGLVISTGSVGEIEDERELSSSTYSVRSIRHLQADNGGFEDDEGIAESGL